MLETGLIDVGVYSKYFGKSSCTFCNPGRRWKVGGGQKLLMSHQDLLVVSISCQAFVKKDRDNHKFGSVYINYDVIF